MTTTADYTDFLAQKRLIVPSSGRSIEPGDLHPALFSFQRDLVRWSLRKGRAALWCDTGLGKTLMQLCWSQHAAERVLILAPLAVAQQTVREGERWGIPVTYARQQDQSAPVGITVTNYEMLDRFEPETFGAVVLDESSILKSYEGKIRTALIEAFRHTPYRLACSATPAPNDREELSNHAEFLGVMSRAEMLSAFFLHDDQGWRLKRHAVGPFYRWLASWAMSLKKPSDIGAYDDTGYNLPPLTIEPHFARTDYVPPGRLFADRLQGVTERAAVRRDTIEERVAVAATLVKMEPEEPWICWVGLNEEGERLKRELPEADLIEGSQLPDEKAAAVLRFLDGETRIMITKSSITGYGLNLQRCARMVFVGIGDSYEQYYQSIRRCWRFGQDRPVTAHIVLSEPERVIYENVLRKEQEALTLSAELVQNVGAFERQEIEQMSARDDYEPAQEMRLPHWLRRMT